MVIMSVILMATGRVSVSCRRLTSHLLISALQETETHPAACVTALRT